MARSDKKPVDPVLVCGLGRFGAALAEALVAMGHEVLALDSDLVRVQELSGVLTSVVQADTTSYAAMKQVGAADFDRAVVGIGADLEASILTVGVLADLGVKHIWAKAVTRAHGRILHRVGAHETVHVERDMGERIAHRVTGQVLEHIELDDTFALIQTVVPRGLVGRTLADARVRAEFGVAVVCVKPSDGTFAFAEPTAELAEGDVLVVAGPSETVARFARLR